MANSSTSSAVPIALGFVMVGFGVHQLLYSKKWNGYVPKVVADIAPVKRELIIKAHGTGNVSLGLLYIFLHKYPIVRWASTAWWLNVMVLCGNHSAKEGLRDLPLFMASFLHSVKSSLK
jgi:hypothetical protein